MLLCREDPYAVGAYATAFVLGFQTAPEDEDHLQASACCKHYVANSMEGTTQNGVHHDRNHFNALIPMQDLVDSYLPPFQACVEKGRASGLMCSCELEHMRPPQHGLHASFADEHAEV